MPAEEFARVMARAQADGSGGTGEEKVPGEDEIREWLELFEKGKR